MSEPNVMAQKQQKCKEILFDQPIAAHTSRRINQSQVVKLASGMQLVRSAGNSACLKSWMYFTEKIQKPTKYRRWKMYFSPCSAGHCHSSLLMPLL